MSRTEMGRRAALCVVLALVGALASPAIYRGEGEPNAVSILKQRASGQEEIPQRASGKEEIPVERTPQRASGKEEIPSDDESAFGKEEIVSENVAAGSSLNLEEGSGKDASPRGIKRDTEKVDESSSDSISQTESLSRGVQSDSSGNSGFVKRWKTRTTWVIEEELPEVVETVTTTRKTRRTSRKSSSSSQSSSRSWSRQSRSGSISASNDFFSDPETSTQNSVRAKSFDAAIFFKSLFMGFLSGALVMSVVVKMLSRFSSRSKINSEQFSYRGV